ncbi:uncharacterized protein PV06_03248 [Exophiala oligosperma]|uniref:RING-type E3 ubiquitin transferase n=1 Tax=Exophiala oligosperma TaxID=215243 RepID=A0A0D2AYA4_9EURO|nr:uncharacterized protein PV06_03248 [Exophiala oligosperma]KIW44801.1 hypothetical protein PV06_03248 [Exophiala oligosperma]
MRPLRFLLLLTFFITLPIALTFFSLFSFSKSNADSFHTGYAPRQRSLRAFFSFQTPSSLFPPSAIISLTADNSTFFLARPAAFGPSLPSKGLSGQLWVGKGFGDDALLKEENIHVVGWELGCSDVPGWGEEASKREKNLPQVDKPQESPKKRRDLVRDGQGGDGSVGGSESLHEIVQDDGTDDYLHHPLPDSNPATPGHLGEPANVGADQKNPTHADIESLQESADIAGKIVMLSRGGCGFLEKVKWAQRRGGIALIVGDNERGAQLTIMYAKGDTSNVTIPAVFTSYTSAHLLASLVPPESGEDEAGSVKGSDKASKGPEKGNNRKQQDGKPVFTSTTQNQRPTIVPAKAPATAQTDKGWVSNVLGAIGLNENSRFAHVEDSRRPPSSGNIDWVLVEDWDDDVPVKSSKKVKTAVNLPTSSTSALRTKPTSSKNPGMDDFVIGVQDWRDTDLVAPKATNSIANIVADPKAGKDGQAEATNVVKPSSHAEDALKGGSITPGSGEYAHEKPEQLNRYNRGEDQSKQQPKHANTPPSREGTSWFDLFRSDESTKEAPKAPAAKQEKNAKSRSEQVHKIASQQDDGDHPGLWVTLTPTSVSTSPFFDTLLVLVISPLVTLTVVYALLLLRSRIRRRRWRAPKSVVERLPVRTYHTMNTASSTTSSQVASPDASSPTSPLLISTSQNVSQRPRPRSQTTNGAFAGSTDSTTSKARNLNLPSEKTASKFARRKRYTGRQIECVVCLEEYVDGESQVMSLPCGHEFHAECITPWLVTRRRTCPICKGDVVRSLARTDSRNEEDATEGEQTSDDVQERAAQTTNEEASAAIPIPTLLRDGDEDVEQGRAVDAGDDVPLLDDGQHPGRQNLATARDGGAVWRSISASVSRLSGETLWRQTPVDRNR